MAAGSGPQRGTHRQSLRGPGWLLVLALAVACTAAPLGPSSTAGPTPTARPSATREPSPTFGPTGPLQQALVVEVVDGDTIKVDLDGTVYTLRYIGIDTPETVDPGSPVEWMGPEATEANAVLVAGRIVTLERDVSERDQFGRLLRYVWLDKVDRWLLVNLRLVELGFALSSAYPPDVRHQDLLDDAESAARESGAGLWGPTLTPTSTPPPAPPPAGNCDSSYPTVCIPPYPPDLDCGDITYRRFQVLAPDPHGFDGDHDGVGCEN